MNRFKDRINVLVNRMVGEVIDLPSPQTAQKPTPLVTAFRNQSEFPDASVSVKVNFIAAVPVSQERGWHTGDDVVVVDEPIMVHLNVVDVPFVPYARASKSEKLDGITGYMRQIASAGTNRCHRTAE